MDTSLRDVNDVIEDLEKIAEMADAVFKKTSNLFGDNYIYSDYGNPLYNVRSQIKNAKEEGIQKLAKALISNWTKRLIPNVDTSLESLLSDIMVEDERQYISGESVKYERGVEPRDLAGGFKAEWLYELFRKKYVESATVRAKNDLLNVASHLLPYAIRKGDNLDVNSIIDKRTIKLRLYNRDGAGLRHNPELLALEKIARVVLEGADPVTVKGEEGGFARIFEYRSFKNGRLDIKFNNEQEARKVARVLVFGFEGDRRLV